MKRLMIITAAMLLAIAGCSQDKKPTQKEQATKEWNTARAGVLAGLARDQYQAGNLDKSAQTTSEALKLDPKNLMLHLLKAKLAMEQGQLEGADKELKVVRELDPKNAEADYLAGIVYQRWQRSKEAFDFYASAAQKNPNELAYILAQSEMLVVMDRPSEALALLKSKANAFEHSAPLCDAMGQLLLQQGKLSDAVEALHQASILATDDDSIREHYIGALYRDAKYPEAAENISRLLRSDKYTARGDLLVMLGDCHTRMGKLHEAHGDFDHAVQINPKLSVAWMNLARLAIESNDLDRADKDLKKALQLEPAAPEAYMLLGYLNVRQNKMTDALTAFRKCAALDPKDSVSLSMIGYALEKMGRSSEAAKYYGKALKTDPRDDLAAKLMASVDLSE